MDQALGTTGDMIAITRRSVLMGGAALAVGPLAAPASAGALDLPRHKVELVAPPFVHAHEQATKEGPRIMEFRLWVEEKKIVIDDEGTTLQAMTFNGSIPGPLLVVHEGDYVEVTLVNPDTNSMAAQHRFPLGRGRIRRRRPDVDQSRGGGRAALEGHTHGRVRLSLHPGRHDPLAYHLRHERRRDGAATGRAQGRRWKAVALRPGLLHWRA